MGGICINVIFKTEGLYETLYILPSGEESNFHRKSWLSQHTEDNKYTEGEDQDRRLGRNFSSLGGEEIPGESGVPKV